MKLTDKLDILMQERGLNKAQLSSQSGVPYTTLVSLYEKGYENAKRSTLLTIARFFNVTLDYLADDKIDERPPQLQAAAAHFDLDKLNDEGKQRYYEYLEMLTERFSKE